MLLRPLEPEDLELLYSIENDPELWSVTDNGGPYSHYALKQYIADARGIHESGELRLVVQTERPIGLIDLMNYSSLHARAEVGIALLKAERGNGYAREALQLLEKLAAERLRIHLLYAYVACDNETSLSLFHRSGYQTVATLPDWCYRNGHYHDTELLVKIISPDVRHTSL